MGTQEPDKELQKLSNSVGEELKRIRKGEKREQGEKSLVESVHTSLRELRQEEETPSPRKATTLGIAGLSPASFMGTSEPLTRKPEEEEAPLNQWQKETVDRVQNMKSQLEQMGFSKEKEDRGVGAYAGGFIGEAYKAFGHDLKELQDVIHDIDDVTGNALSIADALTNPTNPENATMAALALEYFKSDDKEEKKKIQKAFKDVRDETPVLKNFGEWFEKESKGFKEMPEGMLGDILTGTAQLVPFVLEMLGTPEVKFTGMVSKAPQLMAAFEKPLISKIPKLPILEGFKGWWRGFDMDKKGAEALLDPWKEMSVGIAQGTYMHAIGVGADKFAKAIAGVKLPTSIAGKKVPEAVSGKLGKTFGELGGATFMGLGFGGLSAQQYWIENVGKLPPEQFTEGLKKAFSTGAGMGIGLRSPMLARVAGIRSADRIARAIQKRGFMNFISSSPEMARGLALTEIKNPAELRQKAIDLRKEAIGSDRKTAKRKTKQANAIQNRLEMGAWVNKAVTHPQEVIDNIKGLGFSEKNEAKAIEKVKRVHAENEPLGIKLQKPAERMRELNEEEGFVQGNEYLSTEVKTAKLEEVADKKAEVQKEMDDITHEHRTKQQAEFIGEPFKGEKTEKGVKEPAEKTSPERGGNVPPEGEKVSKKPKGTKKEPKKGKKVPEEAEEAKKGTEKIKEESEKKGVKNAEKDRGKTEKGMPEKGMERGQQEVSKVRVRNLEKAGVETKPGEEVRFSQKELTEQKAKEKDAEEKKPKEAPSKVYRLPTGFTHEKGKTAGDVLRFERDELGNEVKLSEKQIKELDKHKAEDVIWVTRKPEQAEKYRSEGEKTKVEEVKLPKGSKIIQDLGEDGMLVLKGKSKAESKEAESRKKLSSDVEKLKGIGAARKGFSKKEILEWVNSRRQQDKMSAKTAEEKKEVNTEWNKISQSVNELFPKGGFSRATHHKKAAILQDVVRSFIRKNRGTLNKIHGRTVPTLMNKVNDIKGPISLNRALNYIDKVVNDKETRERFVRKEDARAEIGLRTQRKFHFSKGKKRDVTKYPDSKAFSAMVDRVAGKRGEEGIRDIIEKKTPEKALEEVRRLEEELESSEYTTEKRRQEIIDRIQDLSFAGLDAMPVEGVEKKLGELKDIIKGVTKEGIKENEARKKTDRKKIDWVVNILRKKKFKKGKVVKAEKEETNIVKVRGKPEKKLFWYHPFAFFTNNIPVILDKFSKYDPKRKGAFHNQMHDDIMPRIQEGQQTHTAYTEKFNKMLEDARKEIFKPKNDRELRRILKNNATAAKPNLKEKAESKLSIADRATTEKVEFTNEATGEKDYLDLNQNIACKYWIMLKDPTLEKTFFSDITHDSRGVQKGMGWTESHVKAVEEYLTPEMKKWGNFLMKKYYPALYDVVNKTYRRINGTDLNYTEFYTNISREGVEKNASIEEVMSQEPMMTSVHSGSLLNRTGSTLPLRAEDVNRSMLAYTDKMLHYASWAEPVRYMQKIFRNPRVKNAIRQWGHESVNLKHMNRLIDLLANKKEREVTGHKLINTIRKRVTRGLLGFKLTIGAKQLLSYPAFAVQLGVGGASKAFKNFAANPAKAWNLTMENPEARARLKGAGGDRDVVYAMAKDFRKGGGTKDWVNFYMGIIRYGDIAPIVMGYPELYRREYKKAREKSSIPEAKKIAQKKAWENVNLWQQSAKTAYLSPLQLENAWAKLFTMYMTAPISYHRHASRGLINAFGSIKRGDLKTKEGRKHIRKDVRRFITAHAVLPSLFTYASNGFQWDKDDQIRSLMFGNLNNLPLSGEILDYFADQIQGKPFGYAPTPASTVVKYGAKTVNLISKMFNEESEKITVDDIEDAIDFTSVSTGVPLQGVYRTADGFKDVLTGETQYPFRRMVGFSEWTMENKGKEKKEKKKKRAE